MPILGTPYHSGEEAALPYAPFAGRQDALARVAALLSELGRANGLLFYGAPSLGKTTLLHAAAAALPDAYVPVLLAIGQGGDGLDAPLTEANLLFSMAEAITAGLIQRQFTLSRLSQIEPPGDDPRGWFELVFLPPIFGALRRERPLVLLIDRAHRLAEAVQAAHIPPDFFAWFSGLLARTRMLAVILAADDRIETSLHLLAPLIRPNTAFRLLPLQPDDVRWLLTAPVQGVFSLTEPGQAAAFQLTGGLPALAQRLGAELYRRWQNAPEVTVIGPREVAAAQTSIYVEAEADFLRAWERLGSNERIVLGALAGLHYDEPLRRASADAIQRWLTAGDTPLDLVTIGSALRSLEYQHWVTLAVDGAALRADVALHWLLAHASSVSVQAGTATLRERPRRYSASRRAGRDGQRALEAEPAALRPGVRRALRWLAIAFVLVVLANVVALALSGQAPPEPASAPTATLFSPPSP